MGSETPSFSSINTFQEASNSDEYFLQHSLLFAESLKDLKNIRAQLYSAADYFESSYQKDEYKQLVDENLKDYTTKALVSTVDHLGSVAHKVNTFLDGKVNEISAASTQFSCIEQRLRTYREFIDRSGNWQQSLVIETPKHHTRYSIPVMESQVTRKLNSIPSGCILCPQDDTQQTRLDDSFAKAFQGSATEPHPPLQRKGHSGAHSNEHSPKPLTFSFMKVASIKEAGKRAYSPLSFPLERSGSIANRSISPSSSNNKQRYTSELRRSSTMSMNPEGSKGREMEVYSRKSRNLFKALLSIHWSRKEGVPHRFRDDKRETKETLHSILQSRK